MQISHKRGATFSRNISVKSDGEVPSDFASWVIASQIRDKSNKLVSQLTVTRTDNANGIFTLSDSSTADWPVCVLYCDIRYTLPSTEVIHTETFEINVLRSVTQ